MIKEDPLKAVKKCLVEGKPALLNNPRMWPQVDARYLIEDKGYVSIDLLGDIDNVLTRSVRLISNAVQFPVSSAFLHSLGLLSAAMTLRFSYEMREGSSSFTPTAIYVASAQPSGAGKSSVHNFYYLPLERAFLDLRRNALKQRAKLKGKIDSLRVELKNQTLESAREMLTDDIFELESKLSQIEIYNQFTTDDPTPEGLTGMARMNGGYFSVLSDEGEALNALLGGRYAATGKTSSANIVLKGYDNGTISVARAKDMKSKVSYEDDDAAPGMFHARGVIASLAQTESINTVIEVGKRGIGVPERFFLLEEEPLMGTRKHAGRELDQSEEMKPLRFAIDELMHAVVKERPIVLKFSKGSMEYIAKIRDSIEPHLAAGGRYGYPIVQGFMAKAERHITGLACLLHVAEQWSPGGQRDYHIKQVHVKQAADLFRKLSVAFIHSVESRGAGTGRSEISVICAKFVNFVERKRMYFMTYRELRDLIKKESAFTGVKDLTTHLREVPLRRLAEMGICLPVKSGIYINPNLK